MDMLGYLTITLFVLWCVSEIVIGVISLRHRSKAVSRGADRFSYFIVWFSTIAPIGFAYLLRAHPSFANGLGNCLTLCPLLDFLGCVCIAAGVTIRLLAVATLNKQFTLNVALVEQHEIVETGMYKSIRHPAYLGHLLSLLGIGLILGNWVGLMIVVVMPLAGILYRIHVEERALLGHFGSVYGAYARRTKRLLPGIW